MAAVPRANVTIVRSWTEGGPAGQERKARQVRVLFQANGGVVGEMPASIFELSKVEECSDGVASDNLGTIVPVPVYGGAGLVLASSSSGAILSANATGTYEFIVKGQ